MGGTLNTHRGFFFFSGNRKGKGHFEEDSFELNLESCYKVIDWIKGSGYRVW